MSNNMTDAKRKLSVADLHASGADGLVVDECGCSLDDFAVCGDGPYPECVPARALTVPEDLRVEYSGHVYHCDGATPGDTMFVPMER